MATSKRVFRLVLATTIAMALASGCAAQAHGGGGSTGARAVDIRVRGGEFHPDTITARAGERLKLVFTREQGPSCVTSILFPSLGIEKELPENQAVPIEITAPPSGSVAFTCPMQHVQGRVSVQ